MQELTAALEGRNAALGNEVAQSRRTETALRHLSNRILHAQEEERKRISRELHDAVGGSLAEKEVGIQGFRVDRAVMTVRAGRAAVNSPDP